MRVFTLTPPRILALCGARWLLPWLHARVPRLSHECQVPDGSTVVGVNKVVNREDVPKEAKTASDDYTWYYDI